MNEDQSTSVLVWAYQPDGRKAHRTHCGPHFSVRSRSRYIVDDLDVEFMHIGNFISADDVLRCCRDDVRRSITDWLRDLPNISREEMVDSFSQYGFDYDIESRGNIHPLAIDTDKLFLDELDKVLKAR